MKAKFHKDLLHVATSFSFLALGLFPLMEESKGSILIIICAVLTCIVKLMNKETFKMGWRLFFMTTLFWMFVIHEIISLDFNFNRILLHLPFLVFPILFYNRPKFLTTQTLKQSLTIFQISLVVLCFYYFFIFIQKFSVSQLFSVSPENIPFFRNFVLNNASVNIHSTYVSSFLLFSLTISAYFVLRKNYSKRIVLLHIFNILYAMFFIILFSSKMIILVLIATILFIFVDMARLIKKEYAIIVMASMTLICGVFAFTFKNIITKRFIEVKTEINKPVKGLYFNSTNIRIAIYECTLELMEELPWAGYGNNLQSQLNQCYEKNYDSNFYKLITYNTHNYYFNLILYGGWLFFSIFLLYIGYLFKSSKHSKIASIIIIQILLINITENFLSRHYGIIVFNFLIYIFILTSSETQKTFIDS